MSKTILSSDASKKKALAAVEEMASVVKATLGPGGNPIIIQRTGQNSDGSPIGPLITKDGVTVAESVDFKDHAMSTIAKAVLQVAKNTVNQAGDGTTTAIVLAEAIFKAGYSQLARGMNGIQLYDELKAIKNEIIAKIDERKIPVGLKDVYNVAKISANGEEEIAQIVSDALEQVGEDGHVTVEDANSRHTELSVVQGAVYKKGWKSFGPFGTHFVTDKVKDCAQLEKPAVLLYNGKLSELHELAKLMMSVMEVDPQSGQIQKPVPFLIIASDFSDDVKNMLLANRVQGKLPIVAIKAPFDGSPNAITEILEDIAVLTGGKVFSKGIRELKDGSSDDLGSCDKVEVGSEETVIFKGAGDEEAILSRVDDLKKGLEIKQYEFDQENLRIRIGKLVGGIAIIRAGGETELEMLEKKDRIEDALCAARVAIQEGILPGGGSTFFEISKEINTNTIAGKIMQEALQAPIKQIITNTGLDPAVILHQLGSTELGKGFDARRKVFCNLLESGIVDPAKVAKSALENAVSIAGLLLTTGGAVVLAASSNEGKPNPLAMMGLE
jgi:chaperonin GroEL